MKLFRVDLEHFGAKSSAYGIVEYLIGDNERDVLEWINQQNYQFLDDHEEDSKEDCGCDDNCDCSKQMVWRNKEWQDENPEEMKRALDMGLEICSCGVYGLLKDVFLWARQDPREPQDCYYGCDVYSWVVIGDITEEQSKLLIELKIAEKL